jgi:hypothetical protein
LTKPGVLHGVSLIPVRRLECVPEKKGYVKIKLFFTTEEPKHIRSYALQHSYGFKGPYLEDICILLPQEKVMPEFSFFLPMLTRLQLAHTVSNTAQLKNFHIMDEDKLTLAYVLNY